MATPSGTAATAVARISSRLVRWFGKEAHSTVCAALASASPVSISPEKFCRTRNAAEFSIAASVSNCATPTIAMMRVAVSGYMEARRTASSVAWFQVIAASAETLPERLMVSVVVAVLPARSDSVSDSLLSPSTSTTSANWKPPLAATSALAPPSVATAAPSAEPSSPTRAAAVMLSPAVPVSELAVRPKEPIFGAMES